ncbi:MAG: DsrE family protein [Desulfuromonadaceae bacterium]|nr:DsrE family protein [Desulfuromonadaceae bacterium]
MKCTSCRRVLIAVLSLAIALQIPVSSPAQDTPPLHSIDNQQALTGVTTANVVFDISTPDPQVLSQFLSVIDTTWNQLHASGLTPHMVLTFRGRAASLVTHGSEWHTAETEERLAQQLVDLQRKGLRLDICAIAAKLQEIDPQDLMAGTQLVANTFISLIGYQSKGYALIRIN